MPKIMFKRQFFGKWRRDDGTIKKLIDEETMFREITQLSEDGWYVVPHGVTHIRAYELVKDSPR